MRFYACMVIIAGLLAGCATAKEKAAGNVARSGTGGAPTVYYGDINRKYRVIKRVREKRPQIPGPNYYDQISGAAWVARLGAEVGADAVIKFGTKRIPGKVFLLDPGEYEAWGIAVKYVN